MIDDEFYNLTSIEANSVYVKNLETYFYASAMDKEKVGFMGNSVIRPNITDTVLQGTVTSIDEQGQRFTLDSELQKNNG